MPDTATDRLAAELAAIRQRSERPVPDVGSLPISHDGVRCLMESAGDVPRLLAAVERVLARHQRNTVTVRRVCLFHSLPGARRSDDPLLVAQWRAIVDACSDCVQVQQVTCSGCDPVCPDDNTWPCPDVRDITSALLGEDSPQ